jgi:hypothetical protein
LALKEAAKLSAIYYPVKEKINKYAFKYKLNADDMFRNHSFEDNGAKEGKIVSKGCE